MNNRKTISIRHFASTLLLAVLCTIFSVQKAAASKQPEVFSVWKKLPTKQLVKIGNRFVNDSEHPDSALLALTIVTNRYDKSMNRDEKIATMIAQGMRSYIYMFRYYDYAKAYDCLLHAQEIADEVNYVSPGLSIEFGNIFGTIGDKTRDRATQEKALGYMRKAFWQSLKINSHNITNTAFGNAITLAWTLGQYDTLKKEWDAYKKLKNNGAPEFTKYNLYYYQILMLLKEKRYQATLLLFDKQISLMSDDETHARYAMIASYNKARVLALLGKHNEATEQLLSCERISQRYKTKDISVELYRELADNQRYLGNKDLAVFYQGRFFSLKDTLLNLQQYANIKEMAFAGSLRKVNDQMEEARHKQQMMTTAFIVLLIIALIVCAFLFLLYRKNRLLRTSYQNLYQKNQEVLQLEEEYKKPQLEEKYKQSRLGETDKQVLFDKVQQVLSSSTEVYEPDFSLQRLAELVESNYKNVSQVINEKAGCNFNSLLNDYRIKEACKRMNNTEEYGMYTIETISRSVGFKSRSTFRQQFKRVTGLAPSEYQRAQKAGE